MSAVDTDGDGSVSEAELTASLKAHREDMMAENGGSMPPPPDSVSGTGSSTGSRSSTSSASGVTGSMSATDMDKLVTSLFAASTSSGTGSTSTSSSTTDSSSLAASLSEYLLRQKASSAYQNVDNLISSLFGASDSAAQSVSVSA